MARRELIQPTLGPDDLVSYNLQLARRLRGWSQEQATAQLRENGIDWSIASLSDAERSWDPDKGRNREFNARDLVIFSRTYGLPLSWWLLPPAPSDRGRDMTIGIATVAELDDHELLSIIFDSSPEVEERLSDLGAERNLTAADRQRAKALLDQQEGQLAKWLEEVRSARETLVRETLVARPQRRRTPTKQRNV